MSKNIKIAIVGLGNCASSLIQGIEYYKDIKDYNQYIPGLMHNYIGKYNISDINIVASFDVDKRKIGKDISIAIFQPPNCTKKFSDVPFLNVEVKKGPILDGIAPHMKDYFQIDDNQKELSKEDIISTLRDADAQIIVSYLPVGSQETTEYWADIAIQSKCAFINAIPVFIASNEEWSNKFRKAELPIIGDDVKSQCGATIINRALVQLLIDRGAKIDNTFQINIGGNTDFLNMTSQDRLESKRISKTESISSLIHYHPNNINHDNNPNNINHDNNPNNINHDNNPNNINQDDIKPYVYAGPNGFIECLHDSKQAYMRIDFKIFGDIDCSIDCKLVVEDSPNSSGIIVDAIRIAKIALDRKISGPIIPACAYFCKRPPIQMKDEDAKKELEKFITYEKASYVNN